MKFYYLPFPLGFISFSKNHFTIYNESQTAMRKVIPNNEEVNRWKNEFTTTKSIEMAIESYHERINQEFFQEFKLFDDVDWIIK